MSKDRKLAEDHRPIREVPAGVREAWHRKATRTTRDAALAAVEAYRKRKRTHQGGEDG